MIGERRLDTPRGPARIALHLPARRALGVAVLLHGAGTGTDRSPLPELGDGLAAARLAAVRLDQPYVVAGRRAPDPAHLLDAVVLAVVPALRRYAVAGGPLALVGRSSGARVACRTASAVGACAVVALGFPLQPRPGPAGPRPDRGAELTAVDCPVLVVQGERDPFGCPVPAPGREVRVIPGARHTPQLAASLGTIGWLLERCGPDGRPPSPPPLPPPLPPP